MQKTRIILVILFFVVADHSVYAQSVADSISVTWTKYIILNDSNQVLLMFDKSYNAWELPGTGYRGPISLRNTMDSVAQFSGIRYDDYALGGIFTYSKPGAYRTTVKPFFTARFKGYLDGQSLRYPKRMKWVDLDAAKKIIPYPTMVMILEQLTKYPKTVWGGAFEEYDYNSPGGTKWKVIEPFYGLN